MKRVATIFVAVILTVSCSYVAVKTTVLPKPPIPVSTPAPILKTNIVVTITNKPTPIVRLPVTVSHHVLRICLNVWRINPKYLMMVDTNYTVIPKEHLEFYYRGFKSFVASNDLVVYKSEKNDCDDIARTFSFYCRASVLKNTNFLGSIAVADVYYNPTPDGAHAVNLIFVYNTDGEYEAVFLDAIKEPFIPGSTYFPTNWYKDIYFLNM